MNGQLPVRNAFDIPDDVAYLNAAYMGPLPNEVNEAGRAALERKSQPWNVTSSDFFDDVERLRFLIGEVCGLDADGVAIVGSVSYGIALAARNIAVSTHQNIVVLDEQFPSNVYAWRALANESSVELRVAVRDELGDPMPALMSAIDADTAVVALAPCHWTDGTCVDLLEIDAIRPPGCRLVLDTAQSLGAMDLHLSVIRPDVVVGAMYKWMLGPYSIAFAWFAEDLRDGKPLENNWITRAESEDFAGLVDYRDEYRLGSRRYDTGEVSNFALVPAAVRACELIVGWTPSRVAKHAKSLTERIAEASEELGCVPTPSAVRAPHLLGLGLPEGVDPQALAGRLAAARVFVSVRGSSVRVSAHVYNTEDDADRLIAALAVGLR